MKNFNEIYKENHRSILNFIFSKVRNVEVSQELANDVFMKINANLSKYDENLSSFKTWIMNIANNTVIDYWRKAKMETISLSGFQNEQSEDENNLDVLSYYGKVSNDTPEAKLINNESLANFRNTLNNLPKTYVKIATLFFAEQYSYEEIASTLDIPLGTVKGQLYRVREMLESKNVKVK